MKNSDQKYIEACERNISWEEEIKKRGDLNHGIVEKYNMYKGKTLNQAKHGLGVRENDEQYDIRILKLIK
jgi:hypothetical protein